MSQARTKQETCPGCGGLFPEGYGTTHRYLGSSSGCWLVYGEILAREYSNLDYFRVHRLTVDAYALQHPGIESPQTIQSAAIHLISLYLCFEKEYNSHNATKAMQTAAQYKKDFFWLEPPTNEYKITVKDVYSAASAQEHGELVTKWAKYTWQAWQIHKTALDGWLSLFKF